MMPFLRHSWKRQCYRNKIRSLHAKVWKGKEDSLKRGTSKLFEVMKMFYLDSGGDDVPTYICQKLCNFHFKREFTGCKLYITKFEF